MTGAPIATSFDAGLSSDASAAEDAGSALDAAAMAGADATSNAQCRWPAYLNPTRAGGWTGTDAQVGPYLLSCRVPPVGDGGFELCISDEPSTCPAAWNGGAALSNCVDTCSADEYALRTGGPPFATPTPDPPPGCRGIGDSPAGDILYCCPCEGVDAGAGDTDSDVHADGGLRVIPALAGSCVFVDLSTYDRSCRTASDCIAVSSGLFCPNTCQNACPNDAINRDGAARYHQTFAQARGSTFCECGNLSAPDARCEQGVCSYCGPGRPCR